MSTDDWTRVKPDFREMPGTLAVTCLLCFLLLLVGMVMGQVHAHKFAGYLNNAMAMCLPAVCFIVGRIVLRADAGFLPLVGPGGLRCHDRFGQYRTLRWDEITSASFAMTHGAYKLLVGYSSVDPPLAIPFMSVDRHDFLALVERCAGAAHPVAEALRRG